MDALRAKPPTDAFNADKLKKVKSNKPSQKYRIKKGVLLYTKSQFTAGKEYAPMDITPEIVHEVADRSLPFYVPPDDSIEGIRRCGLLLVWYWLLH